MYGCKEDPECIRIANSYPEKLYFLVYFCIVFNKSLQKINFGYSYLDINVLFHENERL